MLLLIPFLDMRRHFILRKLAHGLHKRLVIFSQFEFDHFLTLSNRVLKMTAHLTESKLQCANCAIHRLRRYLCNLWKALCYTSRHAEEKSSRGRNHCWSGANELCIKAGNKPEEGDCGNQ